MSGIKEASKLERFNKLKTNGIFRWCMISLLVILGPLVIIDSQYYGHLTLAPFNIIKYNIFTSHGPDLYGTEPWYFYVINGFLNFNIVFPRKFLK